MDQTSFSLPAVFPVTCHTDYVGAGSTFVAIQGYKEDGAKYIAKAIERGATSIVISHDTVLAPEQENLIRERAVALSRVPDTRKALAQLSAQAAGYPAQKLKVLGVTGTKGKSTTCFLLKHVLSSAGYKAALLSTVYNQIYNTRFSAPLTTAQPDYLQQFLKLCLDNGVTHVVLEVAAHALTLHRVDHIEFAGIIFTNFGLEHLEFYDSLENYFAAKCDLLARRVAGAPAFINNDDSWCRDLKNKYPDIITFGLGGNGTKPDKVAPDKVLKILDSRTLVLELDSHRFSCPALFGNFNAYNIAASASLLLSLSLTAEEINSGLQSFTCVPGRSEGYKLANGARGIIDYAHNPLSYEALLPELRAITPHLIVVFGAGGERDASRRPLMGAIAAQHADIVVITNDNPRSENPEKIAQDILHGIPLECQKNPKSREYNKPENKINYNLENQVSPQIIIELDREQAIKRAYALSKPDSIIALLGKGPDHYQIIGAAKLPFNEAEILKSLS
jgi:UDP-N-acetylmuramyl-tripeptide synthetase